MKKYILSTYIFLATFLKIVSYNLFFPKPAFAVICNPVLSNCKGSTNPQGYTNDVLSTVISLFFIVGIIYFLWHIIFAGYHFISTEGDIKRYENAKNQITYSILGIIVIFTIFGLLKFVGTILGITGLENLTISWPTL